MASMANVTWAFLMFYWQVTANKIHDKFLFSYLLPMLLRWYSNMNGELIDGVGKGVDL